MLRKCDKCNKEASGLTAQDVAGVDILASAVRVTLGPKGRNVVLDNANRAESPCDAIGPRLPA